MAPPHFLRQECLERGLAAAERHAQDLRRRLDTAEQQVLDLGPKGRGHDEAQRRALEATSELQALKIQVEKQTEALAATTSSERTLQARVGDLERQVRGLFRCGM